MKNFLKKHNLLPKKEPNGLFHICFCMVCNKSREISSQKLYLHPKNSTYSCNNCNDNGPLEHLWECLKNTSSGENTTTASISAVAADGETASLEVISKILPTLQQIPIHSLEKEGLGKLYLKGVPPGQEVEGIRVFQSEKNGIFISCCLTESNTQPGNTRDDGDVESVLPVGEYFESMENPNFESMENPNFSFFLSADSHLNRKAKGFLFSKKDQPAKNSENDENNTQNLQNPSSYSTANQSAVFLTNCLKTFIALQQQSDCDVLFIPISYLNHFNPRQLHPYDQIFLWEKSSVKHLQSTMAEVGFVKFFTPKSPFLENSVDFSATSFSLSSDFFPSNFTQVPHPNLFSLATPTTSQNGRGWNWENVFSEYQTHSKIAFPFLSLPQLSGITKGFRPGELTIFSGPTGCGKTTFLSQLSLDLCSQGIRTLWGSFEIKNTRLIAKMFRQTSPKPIEALSESELATLQSNFQSLPMFFMGFFGSALFEDVLDTMEYSVRTNNISHIILDNLQFMLSGQDSGAIDKFAIADRVIGQLREFASKRNVHVTVVVHPRKEDDGVPLGMNSISGTAKATQEADTVMILQNLAERGRVIEVKKNRFDGTLGSIPLGFDKKIHMFFELTKK